LVVARDWPTAPRRNMTRSVTLAGSSSGGGGGGGDYTRVFDQDEQQLQREILLEELNDILTREVIPPPL
jgi:hypothetical protein